MSLRCGEHVAFVTQDTEPQPGWLVAMPAALAVNELGLICGPRLRRKNTSRITHREPDDWSASRRPARFAAADLGVPPAPSTAKIASSTDSCPSRAARLPVLFRPVGYTEGQQIVFDLLRAWTKAWEPVAVLHPYRFRPGAWARRWLDEFSPLHDGRCWVASAEACGVAGTGRQCVVWHGVGSVPYHLGHELTASVSTRNDRLRDGLRRWLSREERA